MLQLFVNLAGGRNARILDFDSGVERYTPPFLTRVPDMALAYDISRATIDKVRQRCPAGARSGLLQLVCGNMAELRASEATAAGFDLILLMFGVLGDIHPRRHRVDVLRTLCGPIRPGGRLVVTLPKSRRLFLVEQEASQAIIASGEPEHGDILYEREAESEAIRLFYHLSAGRICRRAAGCRLPHSIPAGGEYPGGKGGRLVGDDAMARRHPAAGRTALAGLWFRRDRRRRATRRPRSARTTRSKI